MVKKKTKENSMHSSCCGRGGMMAKGILFLVLGISLWMTFLILEEVVAIILALVGIKKIYHSRC